MATLKLIKNGVNMRKRNGSSKTVAKKANPSKRRNPVTKASATAFAKRNGLKLVKSAPSKVANGRKRKRYSAKRRNGIVKAIPKRSNGILGNSKETVVSVSSLLAGLVVTKVESAMLAPVLAQPLGMFGLQNFAKPIVEAGFAVTVNRIAADAIKKGSGKFVMYGGLAMAGMSLIENLIPQVASYNPFSRGMTTPIVLNQPSIVDANALRAAQGGAALGTAMRPRVGMNYRRPAVGVPY